MLVGRPAKDAAGDELCQPVGEDVARDSEPRLELFEMVKAVKRAAQDQECPLLADMLDRSRERTMQRRLAERSHVRCQLTVRQPLSSWG